MKIIQNNIDLMEMKKDELVYLRAVVQEEEIYASEFSKFSELQEFAMKLKSIDRILVFYDYNINRSFYMGKRVFYKDCILNIDEEVIISFIDMVLYHFKGLLTLNGNIDIQFD